MLSSSALTLFMFNSLIIWATSTTTSSLKSLSVLEKSITAEDAIEGLCDLVILSQKEISVAEMTYGANRARLVFHSQEALPYKDKTKFAFSRCLILVAGLNSNVTHLIGVGKKLQLLKPVAIQVVRKTTDLIYHDTINMDWNTPYPLLLIGDHGEFKLNKYLSMEWFLQHTILAWFRRKKSYDVSYCVKKAPVVPGERLLSKELSYWIERVRGI